MKEDAEASLASIHSPVENEFVFNLIKDLVNEDHVGFWIGLYHRQIRK